MPVAIPPRDTRPYDVLVWGATGFTGALVAQYLSGSNGRTAFTAGEGMHRLRWALGGRSQQKLDRVKSGLRLNAELVDEPGIVLADSDDQQALQRMTAQTRVVISTVGPFAKYGEPLIAACVKTGTDYVDITGESPWVDCMIRKYNEQATRAGALIVNMCGYDSVPADVCAFLVADYLRSQRHVSTGHMEGYASAKGGGVSGGTVASILNLQESPVEGADVRSAYLLNPEQFKYPQTRPQEKEHLLPGYDNVVGKWKVPFVMALVNTRVVRRSLALRRQLEREIDGYGSEASYNESMTVPNALAAAIVWVGLAIFGLMLLTSPTRAILKFFLPKSGEGPSEERRANTTFQYRVVGTGDRPDDEHREGARASSAKAVATMRGGDPGYDDTAKFISEMALLLAKQREEAPLQQLVKGRMAAQGQVGGFYTPSLVGGHLYVDRLKHAGLKIDVGDFKEGAKASKAD